MKNLIVTLVLAAALLSTSVYAQNTNYKFSKNDYENLTIAIQSDNTGLKKSAIYFAGKYELSKLSDVLIEELKEEKDASVKILISLALYRIGSEEGLDVIENLSKSDSSEEVRRMSKAIIEQAEMDKNLMASSSTK